MIAVLDKAGVTALAPHSEEARARLRALRQRADDLVLPAAVLAEGLLTGHPGRDHHVRRLLSLLMVADVTETLGLVAGELRTGAIRGGAHRPPSGVDAIVVAVADSNAAHDDVEIVTSDTDDIAALLVSGRHAARVSIIRV